MMKRQLHRMRQLAQTGSLGRTPETAEFLGEELLQVEQRLEPAKRAAHNVHKRLQACLQGQSGADMDKRVKKLPLMALSSTMAESFKELDPDSSMGKALEMSCAIQNQLARILAEFEMALERGVLQPLSWLSEEELPAILKHKKSLQKLVSDWNTLKSRLSQAAKNSGSGQGLGGGPGSYSHTTAAANKVETLREEEEELKRRVEQCKDEYLADLYHFATKEDSYANYFIHLLEIQADYHRRSLNSLDTALAELRENHGQADLSPSMTTTPSSRVYGVSLGTHLRELGRDIALPIEACVLMLLSQGMQEEGLFRLAAGASVLKRLKQAMALDPRSLEGFCSDPHAVAGALKSYLRELPEPLMTFDLYDDWMRAASLKESGARLEALREVCGSLPPENFSNLRYLMKFLALLAEEQDVNKMTPSNIAIVLGPNLLWPSEKEGDQAQLDAASVSSIQVVGVVEALIQSADILFPGDIDFNVSGLFSALAPQDKVGDGLAPEDTPLVAVPRPATTPAPAPALALGSALVTPKERPESEAPPRPVSPMVNRSTWETAAPAEDTARRTKRPAPARPTMPPPQLSSTRSSPPVPPPTPSSPVTPRALPRRLVGSSLRAPTVPPPLPPVAPQPARRQSRRSPASPSPTSAGQASPSSPVQVETQRVHTEEGAPPEAVGGVCAPQAVPPQPQPRGLASETD
ncbi:SH3 domain-binding protein 1 isoform X2 [Fukomys damarensis]|uniref:SH3 domain-binding protein 1 n=1 Tax=Fukomys damarensis TaxID=885580 RepID=A0A091DX93_FUKDA|nr:SH3 domain-binding protein 1 isoform X2 [Fukomys damarensis]KFO36699.1 SH3 domain-binding protein 1 [Fukomys damarensis]